MPWVRVTGRHGVATSAGDAYPGGAPVLLPEAEARALIARGRAVAVPDPEVSAAEEVIASPDDPVADARRVRPARPERRR